MTVTKKINQLLLISSFAALTACGGSEDREQKYLDKAQAYFQEKNYDKTRVELKNVLQINPKNIEATYLLAQIAESEQNWRKVYGLLAKVIEANPSHLDAQIKLGKLLLLSNDEAKASEKAELVLSQAPDNVDATNLKATILLKNKDLIKSAELLNKSLSLDPGNLDASLLLTRIHRSNKNLDEALQTLDNTIAKHPEALRPALVKIEIYAQQGNKELIEQAFISLIKQHPENQKLYFTLTKHYINEKRLDDGEKVLQDLITQLPEENQPKIALVNFMMAQRSMEQAETTLLQFIKETPDNYAFRFFMLTIYKDQPEKIKQILNKIIEDDPLGKDGLEAKTRLAALAIQEKDLETSLKLLDQVISENQTNQAALLMRSGLYLSDKKTDAAIADLRTVLRENPESEKALIMLASAQLQNNKIDLVKDNLEKVLTINPKNLPAAKDLSKILSKEGDQDRSLKILLQANSDKSKDQELALMLIDLYAQQKTWDKAEKQAERLLQFTENKDLAYYKLAQLKMAQDDSQTAEINYKKALAIKPLAVDAIGGLINAYLSQNKIDNAKTLIQDSLTQQPDNIVFLNMKAKLHQKQNQLTDAEKAYTRILELTPKYEQVYLDLATIHLVRKEIDQALAVYDKGLVELPESILILMRSTAVKQMTQDITGALAGYKKILSIQPNNVLATNNYAVLLSNNKEDKEGLKLALELASKLKDLEVSSFQDTYGWTSFLNGQYDQALTALEKSVNLKDSTPENNYHLAMVYLNKGRTAEALLELEKAVVDGANYVDIEIAKAELAKLKKQ